MFGGLAKRFAVLLLTMMLLAGPTALAYESIADDYAQVGQPQDALAENYVPHDGDEDIAQNPEEHFVAMTETAILNRAALSTGHAPNTWFEAVWFEWQAVATANFTAQISANDGANWTTVDSELVRFINDEHGARWRVDVPGLPSGDGQEYSLRILHGSSELHRLDNLTPRQHARYGHAFIREPVTVWTGRTWHFPFGTTGGNTPDGGVAPGTEIWYITNDNLYMLDYLSHRTDPLIVRFIGTVGDPGNGILPPGRTFQNKVMIENSANITLEGVGYDTLIWGIGFCVHNSANIIFRNLEMLHATHDAIWLLGPVTHVWITNNTFHFSGDGSTDNTKARNFTISYNQYIGTRQTGLSNGDGAMQDGEATYFRNWYYFVQSRTPMLRNTNAWIFNNFFDHNGENAITHRHGSSVIAEGNVIRGSFNYNMTRSTNAAPRLLLGGQGTAFTITYEGTQAAEAGRNAVITAAQASAGGAQNQITIENLRALEQDPRAMGRTFSGGTFSAAPGIPSTDAQLQEFIDSLVPNDLGYNRDTGVPAIAVGNNASGGASRLWLPEGHAGLAQRLIGSIHGTDGPATWIARENLIFQPFNPRLDFPGSENAVLPADVALEHVRAFSGPMQYPAQTIPTPEQYCPFTHVSQPVPIAVVVTGTGSVGFRMGVMPWAFAGNSFMEWDQGLGPDNPNNWVRVTGSVDEAPHNFTTAAEFVTRDNEYFFRFNHEVTQADGNPLRKTSMPMRVYWATPNPADDETILGENDLNDPDFNPEGWGVNFEENFDGRPIGAVRGEALDELGIGLAIFGFVSESRAIPFDPYRVVAGPGTSAGSSVTPAETRLSNAWLPDIRRNDAAITNADRALGFATFWDEESGYGDSRSVGTDRSGHLIGNPRVNTIVTNDLAGWEGRGNVLMLRDWTNGVANERESQIDRYGTAMDLYLGQHEGRAWVSFDFLFNRDRTYTAANNTYSSSFRFHFYNSARRQIAHFQTNSPTQNDPQVGLHLEGEHGPTMALQPYDNRWMRFDIVFDFDAGYYDVYVDGTIFQYGVAIPHGIRDISYLQVTTPVVNTGTPPALPATTGLGNAPVHNVANVQNILLDNIRVLGENFVNPVADAIALIEVASPVEITVMRANDISEARKAVAITERLNALPGIAGLDVALIVSLLDGQWVVTVTDGIATDSTTIEVTIVFVGTNPNDLRIILSESDVSLDVRGNLGIFTHHSPFVIPVGRTLTVISTLNVQGGAELVIEGMLVVLEDGRVNNQGGVGGTIVIAYGGRFINYGHVENVTNSAVVNYGTIENNARFEIRAGTRFHDCGEVIGTLSIHRNAIFCDAC